MISHSHDPPKNSPFNASSVSGLTSAPINQGIHMNTSVFCIAATESQAQGITNTLHKNGFSNDDISVLFSDRSGTRDFAHEQHTKAPEGAVTGASTGGALGGALGWVIGIGALAIPGVGPFIAAGPIMALLAGAAVGAAVGGITGALIGMGIPEIEAKRYEGKIKAGNILISVHADNAIKIETAKRIFREANAQDISSTGESAVPQNKGTSKPNHDADKRKSESTTSIGAAPIVPKKSVRAGNPPRL